MKNKAIDNSTRVSFHTDAKPNPFNITDLTIIMNQVAGTILEIYCNAAGIFSTGKIKPESNMVGSIKPRSEISIATC